MGNMDIYNALRVVPDSAKKQIIAGRLKGMTDINPMWRIRALTEKFGPCGFGWKYTIDRQWTEIGSDGQVSAFCNISLYVKVNGEWSDAIPGTGGSAFIANERNGAYTSDECYKMAQTDALSVAFKALGGGADVYWDKDETKYSANQAPASVPNQAPQAAEYKKSKFTSEQKNMIITAVKHLQEKYGEAADAKIREIAASFKAGAINDIDPIYFEKLMAAMAAA